MLLHNIEPASTNSRTIPRVDLVLQQKVSWNVRNVSRKIKSPLEVPRIDKDGIQLYSGERLELLCTKLIQGGRGVRLGTGKMLELLGWEH